MKTILKSTLIIGVLGAVVWGVTNAYFSDTETSVGNSFQAGKIDLKVDHVFASYNDEDCGEGDCVEVGANLILNDGFEGPPTVTHSLGWDIFPDGTANLGWSVEWVNATTPYQGVDRPDPANIEFHKNGNLANTSEIPDGWIAHTGQQYIELDSDWNGHTGSLNNEPALARIYQDVATQVGTKYRLSYWHSYRPGQGGNENDMNVYADGNLLRSVSANGAGQTTTNWTQYTDEFVATGATTRIAFEGAGNDNSLGIFLDDVALYELSCQTQIGDNQCRLWDEKDLDPEDIFWNFGDIKPGDRGRDVFSLHVYDNDAWACLFTNKDDQENVLTPPEANAGDVTDPEGELSNYFELFVWKEVGTPDGVYDPLGGEDDVYEGALADFVGLAEPGSDPLAASTTYYYGMAWCLGDQTVNHGNGDISCNGAGDHNDAQTDTLTVDLSFYAEQVRNNPDFSCQSVLVSPTPSVNQ